MSVLRFIRSILAACLLCSAPLALAGITYQIESPAPDSGGPVVVKGILFNDTNSALTWKPEPVLALSWRTADGRTAQTEAALVSSPDTIELPVNNFVALRWETELPAHLHGLLTVRIQDQETLLALDTSGSTQQALAQAPPPASAQAPADDAPGAGGQAVAARAPADSSPAFENFRNAISTHDPIYFAVGSTEGTHARFQVSFKYRLFSPNPEDEPRFIDHFYLGYTQTSLWDLDGDSKPFIDTTYNPSVFWRQDKLLASKQERAFLGLAAGVEHKSNGKSGDASRSLNNTFIQPEFNYRFGDGSTLTFAPRLKSYFSTKDNPDYSDYAGNVDWKLRWAQDEGLVLAGMYRQGKYGRNTWQMDAAWPLRRTPLNMNGYLYVQYFKGYGDTLLGYNEKSSSRVRVGLALVP